MAKILLAEDEVNIASFIERGLKEFGHSVTVCHDGNTGWKILQEEPFDLLILDIIMPKINGLELCHLYRQMFGYQTPVIMLTALGTTEDIVKGLDAGADDYLGKPFALKEVQARLNALIRRRCGVAKPLIRFRDITFNPETKGVLLNGEKVILSPRETALLELLLLNKNKVLSKETIENKLY